MTTVKIPADLDEVISKSAHNLERRVALRAAVQKALDATWKIGYDEGYGDGHEACYDEALRDGYDAGE